MPYGAYGNWTATTLAAIFGAVILSPIIGAGHSALPWQKLVTIGFNTVGIAVIAFEVLVLWGLWRATVMIVAVFSEHIWTRGSWHGSGVAERTASWKRSWRR